MDDQLAQIAGHGSQHGDGIAQLLPRALQFGKRRVGAAMAAFPLQTPQAAARVAERLPGALQIVGYVGELVSAGLLLRRALFRRRLLDEQPLLGGEIDGVAHLRHQHPLPGRNVVEVGTESQRIGAGVALGDGGEQLPHLIAGAALIVDQPVQAACQLVALLELIDELQNASGDKLQVHPGVVVRRRSKTHGVVEPRGALTQEVQGGFHIDLVLGSAGGGRFGIRLGRQGQTQVEGHPVPQLRVGTGVVARRQERLRGAGGVPLRQALQPEVVVAAGGKRRRRRAFVGCRLNILRHRRRGGGGQRGGFRSLGPNPRRGQQRRGGNDPARRHRPAVRGGRPGAATQTAPSKHRLAASASQW